MALGFLILSRHPIVESSELTFDRSDPELSPDGLSVIDFVFNGFDIEEHEVERTVAKGAVQALIAIPQMGYVHFLNTHMVSNYSSKAYTPQRASQLQELLEFANGLTVEQPAPVILAGDFNFGPWEGASGFAP